MSVVIVNTEPLEAGGSNVIKYYNGNRGYYDAVSGTSISSCLSFDTFKESLKLLLWTYTLAREYIPDGVVDWNSNEWKAFDWVFYFQQNNPDQVSA